MSKSGECERAREGGLRPLGNADDAPHPCSNFPNSIVTMTKKLMKLACLGLTASGALLLTACTSTDFRPATITDGSTYTTDARRGHKVVTAPAQKADGKLRDSGRVHQVVDGDTIYNISYRFGLDPQQLMALNGIKDPTQMSKGTILRLPQSVREARPYSPNANVRVNAISTNHGVTDTKPVVATVKPATTRVESVAPVAPVKPVEAVKPVEPVGAVSSARVDTPKVVPGTRMLWPIKGRILEGFSPSNKGIDIDGKKGDVIVAAMDGEVLFANTGVKGFGKLVIIKHANNLVTAYAHCDSFVVKTKQKVRAGEKIAEVGSTDAKSPRLHFEVRQKGRPVDPLKFLPKP